MQRLIFFLKKNPIWLEKQVENILITIKLRKLIHRIIRKMMRFRDFLGLLAMETVIFFLHF